MRKVSKKKKTFSFKSFIKKLLWAAVLTAIIVCILFILHAVRSGVFTRMFDSVSAAYTNVLKNAGFRVSNNILSYGRERSDIDSIRSALNISDDALITRLDLNQMQENLKKLPWVKQARIYRQLPNTLHVYLTERKPIALFQQKNSYFPIDEDGELIPVDEGNVDELIIVVGKGAPAQTPALINALDKQAQSGHIRIKDRVMGAAYVNGRRWQLYIDDLNDGIIVDLPDTDLLQSLNRLDELHHKHHVLDKQIRKLDLRLNDKVYVTPINADSVLKPFGGQEKK